MAPAPYPVLFAGAGSDAAALVVARKAGRAPRIDDIRAWSARPQWQWVRRSNGKKARERRLNSGVSETGRCRLGGTGVFQSRWWWRVVVVCPTAMHARTDEKVAAGDDGGGGGLVSCYVIVLGPWLRGKHVLPRDGEAWVETVRRLRMVKASTWAAFLHTMYC